MTDERRRSVAMTTGRPRPIAIIFRPGDDRVERLTEFGERPPRVLIVYGGGPLVTQWCDMHRVRQVVD